MMGRVLLDTSLTRLKVDAFSFPLGAYPTEALTPVAGYTVHFEPADGSEGAEASAGEADWEEWPDRYVFDIVVTHERLRPLVRALLALLPGRVFPILDILGYDAYREVDPYVAYSLVGIERFLDGARTFDPWLMEDGLVGFGAMSVDPFVYVFVDEHKIVTVRAQTDFKERVERLLAAFDLSPVEEVKGADAVAHEHRSVILAADDRPQFLNADEIFEHLLDAWALQLNVDATTNVDADGKELGISAWQCVVRCSPPAEENATEPPETAYAEVLVTAENLQTAEGQASEAVGPRNAQDPTWEETEILRADRVSWEQFEEWLGAGKAPSRAAAAVHDVRWLSGHPSLKRNENGKGGGTPPTERRTTKE